MTEADRFLEEKLNRGKKPASPPDIPGGPPAQQGTPSARSGASPASQAQGTKWLDFVNYVLVPGSVVLSVVALCIIGSNAGDMALVMVGILVDIVVGIALFFGLRNRTPWGWWLMMALLVVKAPLAAMSRYAAASMKADLYSSIQSLGYSVGSRAGTDVGPFVLLALAGFVLFCLPQMIYFHRRRGLFHVTFEGDRT